MLLLVIVLVDYLARVFFGPIYVMVSTTLVEDVDNIDFEGWVRALNSLFLILVAMILLLLFSGLVVGFL